MKQSYAISILLVLGLLALSACSEPVAAPTPTPTPTTTPFPCHAEFFAEPTVCDGPTWVQFTDQSTGHITSWEWDFGDGGTNTEQNPAHYYNRDGSYSVTLTITGPGCDDTLTKDDCIEVHGCRT